MHDRKTHIVERYVALNELEMAYLLEVLTDSRGRLNGHPARLLVDRIETKIRRARDWRYRR